MTSYVGCEQARELLDGLLDGELQMADQVAVESHLRWCRTCAFRVEDMRMIGASLRLGSPGQHAGDDQALAAANAGTLMRIRAEREASFAVRIPELFVDMRLLWPALGATAAVAICVSVAFGVLQAAAAERPESLAAMIQTLSDPGSERNPMRPDGGNSIPRVLDDGVMLEGIPNEDGVFFFHTIVSREGRVARLELLRSDTPGDARSSAAHDEHVEAVVDAVRQSRFAPAQTPMGRAVAVNMVWMLVVTTAEIGKEKASPARPDAVLAAPAAPTRPAAVDVVPPVGRRSSNPRALTTA